MFHVETWQNHQKLTFSKYQDKYQAILLLLAAHMFRLGATISLNPWHFHTTQSPPTQGPSDFRLRCRVQQRDARAEQQEVHL